MIKLTEVAADFDAVPQAIFWRPLKYFSANLRQDRDDLDDFSFVTYAIGNFCNCEMRTYRGHNGFTATLFFSRDNIPSSQVSEAIDTVIRELKLPDMAVAWRRGMKFEYGKLDRNPNDRLHEEEARNIVLKIAASCAGGHAATTYIKNSVPKYFELTTVDKRISPSRKNEQIWRQIVGNVISHKSLFKKGLAFKDGAGLTVTPEGLSYLKSIGFLA